MTDSIQNELKKYFAEIDTDEDGFVTQAEMKARPELSDYADAFKEIDKDGDGKVSLKELLAFL